MLVWHIKAIHGAESLSTYNESFERNSDANTEKYSPLTKIIVASVITVLLIGTPVAGIFLQKMVTHSRSQWPTVQGTVTNTRLMTSSTQYSDLEYVTVWFTYSLNGATYSGKQEMAAGERELAKYNDGGQVTIYYNPGNPKMGLVNPIKSFMEWVGDILPAYGLVAIIGCAVIWSWALNKVLSNQMMSGSEIVL